MNKLVGNFCFILLLFATLCQAERVGSQGSRYIILTFDDNKLQMASDQTVAIMDSYGYKGVAFAVVDWTGPSNPIWAHIMQEGWEIGCHTWTHADLNNVSASQLNHEIVDAKASLEQMFGIHMISFAYPGSEAWNNATVLQKTANAGFLYARDGGFPSHWTGQKSLQVDSRCPTDSSYASEVQIAINNAMNYGVSVMLFHETINVNDTHWSYESLTPDEFRYCLTQIKNSGLIPVTFEEWDQIEHGTLPPQNVQIAVSSVAASSYSDGHPPGLAVDGVEGPDNYWGTNAGVPQGVVPQWLRLDLGSVYAVNSVVTHFYDGFIRTYTYYVQVSNDGSSWTTVVSTKTGSGSVTDSFSQVGARFVRITVTANTANPAAHIEEAKVYGPSSGPTPLPPQDVQIAVSGVAASSYSDGHPPGLAVDGVEGPDNYWGTNAGVPQGVVPQWLRLDLGSVYRMNAVVTHFYDGSVRTYTYYIQVCNDSSSWTTVVSIKTGSGSVTDSFSQVGARFVRITVTANTANPAAHIEEAKVYGPS